MCFLAFCSMMQLFARKMKFSWNVSEKKKIYQKQSFLAKGCVIEQDARKQTLLKIQFYCPYNIPYPLGPFLKLGNGMVWFWSYFYTFLPSNQQFCPHKRWASWFVWKCENESEDDMDKNGLPWEENDYVKLNICVQINGLKIIK